jgi:hypothetical protein
LTAGGGPSSSKETEENHSGTDCEEEEETIRLIADSIRLIGEQPTGRPFTRGLQKSSVQSKNKKGKKPIVGISEHLKISKEIKDKTKIKKKDQDINIWHDRMGHIGEDALRLTIKGLTGELKNCETCQLAKHKKNPYNHKEKREKSISCLDIIFSDVMGPMQEEGENGERYAVMYIH